MIIVPCFSRLVIGHVLSVCFQTIKTLAANVVCASANPYMLPMGASNSPMKFSFTASRTAGGFSSPRSSSHIENALDGTVAWRGDESEDDRYADSDEDNEREEEEKSEGENNILMMKTMIVLPEKAQKSCKSSKRIFRRRR